MTDQIVREQNVTSQQQQIPIDRPADIKVPNIPSVPIQQQSQLSSQNYNKEMSHPITSTRASKLEDMRTTSKLEGMHNSQLQGAEYRSGKLEGDFRSSKLEGGFTSSKIDGGDMRITRLEGDLRSTKFDDLRDTVAGTTFQQSGAFRESQTANFSQITVIDKKLIVEKINETHFETQYVQKTIPVAKEVLNEMTVVTGIQETRRVPVTRLVEIIEQVPIKVVEEVIEYKTIPVTKFEEVIEQVPVKKYVPRTEYKKVAVTKLVERTENVSVKRVKEEIEYITFTCMNPIQPVPFESFNEAHSGIIQGSSLAGGSMYQHSITQQGSNLQGSTLQGSNLQQGVTGTNYNLQQGSTLQGGTTSTNYNLQQGSTQGGTSSNYNYKQQSITKQ